MKKLFFTALAAMVICSTATYAQELKLPASSSTQSVTQEFGLSTIKLTYARPNVKNRKVFGGLVPYGEVWRTGANSATVLTFSDEIKIEGTSVPAGEYALFTIPGESEWTIILNKDSKIWGAYEYKQANDVFRFKVKPGKLAAKQETFTISFEDVLPTSCKMVLSWDNTSVPVKLATENDSKVMANIEQAMKGDKKPYFQAAVYYLENGKDLKKALEWATAAEAQDQKAPWVKLVRGRLQLINGDKKGAAATAEAGIKAAKDMNIQEYVRLNEALLADAKK